MVYVISEDKFSDLCNRLQSNDPETTCVVVRWKRAAGLDYRLGQALLANTVVTTLDLDVTSLLSDDVTDNTDSANPLLEYIEKSSVLKCVKLCQDGSRFGHMTLHVQHAHLMKRIDAAIGQSSSITECTVNGVSCFEMSQLLASSRSITDMHLLVTDRNTQAASQTVQTSAWSMNQSLRRLDLNVTDCDFLGSILSEFGSHSCLEDLRITWTFRSLSLLTNVQNICAGLHRLLIATTTLQGLAFYDVSFDREGLEAILLALVSKQTVTSLRFMRCTFDGETTEALVAHVQGMSDTHALTLEYCRFFGAMGGTTAVSGEGVCVRCMAGSKLKALTFREAFNSYSSTSYQPVATGPRTNVQKDDLFAAFNQNDDTPAARLTSLRFSTSRPYSMASVVRALPKMLYLQELCIGPQGAGSSMPTSVVLSALRANGSLHRFTIQASSRRRFFRFKERRRAKAYGLRNQHIPRLLSTGAKKSNVHLVPNLMVAAAARHMAAKTVLMGLLSRPELLNDNGDKKRKAS